MDADRELHARTVVRARPEVVWALLTDTRALAVASPELLGMTPLKPGGFRAGQVYIGWNRRKLVVWPTRNVVRQVVPQQSLIWDTRTSGARWIYELTPHAEGTLVTHRRPVPKRLTLLSRIFAGLLLGGGRSHADELETGMRQALEHLKRAAELHAGPGGAADH
ncbi:SRPBCC family protein [Kitasatospora sp. NPDC002227]|uniref:SRPBCC family protein n=1 Tax=Kitasatospora sp. NPDC002227 TaxID=3154773 RepID=UPI00332E3AB1